MTEWVSHTSQRQHLIFYSYATGFTGKYNWNMQRCQDTIPLTRRYSHLVTPTRNRPNEQPRRRRQRVWYCQAKTNRVGFGERSAVIDFPVGVNYNGNSGWRRLCNYARIDGRRCFLLLSHSPGGAPVLLDTHVVCGTRGVAYILIQSVMCTCCV